MPPTPDQPSNRDRDQLAGVRDTFPASDPVANTAERGTRAVDLGALDPGEPPSTGGLETFEQGFETAEHAKLALEGLVRDGPFDRRLAAIVPSGGGVMLRLHAAAADVERLQGLLSRTSS